MSVRHFPGAGYPKNRKKTHFVAEFIANSAQSRFKYLAVFERSRLASTGKQHSFNFGHTDFHFTKV